MVSLYLCFSGMLLVLPMDKKQATPYIYKV